MDEQRRLEILRKNTAAWRNRRRKEGKIPKEVWVYPQAWPKIKADIDAGNEAFQVEKGGVE